MPFPVARNELGKCPQVAKLLFITATRTKANDDSAPGCGQPGPY